MKVILLENVKRIGNIGEVIDVKRGFARNFLIANHKALYASKENIREVEKIKADLSKKGGIKPTPIPSTLWEPPLPEEIKADCDGSKAINLVLGDFKPLKVPIKAPAVPTEAQNTSTLSN